MTGSFFDIVVPTYKRCAELPVFFDQNKDLQFAPCRIFLIDDGTPGFDPDVVPAWANLLLIRFSENRGQSAARNAGIAAGTSPYVISLDDDAWFEQVGSSFSELVRLFEANDRVGCIMFNIATPTSGYSTLQTLTELPLHITCGCAYRRSVLAFVGGFSEFLHSGGEETDLSLKIYQAGYRIVFCEGVKVHHNFMPAARSLSWYLNTREKTVRNDLLTVWMYYPWWAIPVFLPGKFISHLLFAIKNKWSIGKTLWRTATAASGFLFLLPEAWKNRRPLSSNQFRFWYGLNRKSTKL